MALNMQDKRELERTTRVLALKVAQIIVQSRSGEKVKSECRASSTGADWFNLAIQDSPEVSTETKRSLREELIDSPIPLCIEISVRTVEGHSTVLETWTLGVLPEHVGGGDSTVKVTNTVVYNRMGTLLKSLLAVSRMTPAYRISRGQGPDSYVICYRIFMGEPQIHSLGDNYKHIRVGQVRTPAGMIHLSVSYRTKMTFSPTRLSSERILLKSDHFQSDLSPQQKIDKKFSNDAIKVGAFAAPDQNQMPVNDDDPLFDIPFNSLLIGTPSPAAPAVVAPAESDELQSANNNNNNKSNESMRRSTCSSIASANDAGFIMVDLKSPFATANTNSDLGTFYRACQNAPQLRAFADDQTLEQQVGDLGKQLENFETSMHLYDDFVDSLCKESKSNNN